jgi:hypothetical protein
MTNRIPRKADSQQIIERLYAAADEAEKNPLEYDPNDMAQLMAAKTAIALSLQVMVDHVEDESILPAVCEKMFQAAKGDEVKMIFLGLLINFVAMPDHGLSGRLREVAGMFARAVKERQTEPPEHN